MLEGEFRLEQNRKLRLQPFVDHKGQLCVYTEENYLLDDTFGPDDKRHLVARLHCFRLADLSIGASGKMDPKEIVIGNTQYRQLSASDPRCGLCEGGDMIPPDQRFMGSKYRP